MSAALLVGLSSILFPAAAAPTAEITPSPVAATVGVAVDQPETFTSSIVLIPLTLDVVAPETQSGLTLQPTLLNGLRLSGTPSTPGSITFTVVATDLLGADTATLTVDISCPNLIDVDSRTASVCLPDKPTVTVGDQGSAVGDTATGIIPGADDPHVAYSTQADGCAACHRTHADDGNTFAYQNTMPRALECLSCHNGTGATTNVQYEYSDSATGGNVNNPATHSYYTHDALAVNTGHIAASSDEEGGSVAANEFQGVLNRHDECVDCHNPHATSLTPVAVQRSVNGEAVGWALSSANMSASVALVQADTTTAFVGHATTADNFEYQLCAKCHSGFTVLGGNDPLRPSRDWLDKGAEINPTTAGNNSFHPIMAPGTNQSETMTASLTGTSAYKLWKFSTSDTVRCTNCHASGAKAGGPGQVLAPHAAPNRGILILSYRDRVLLGETETADTSRFALCFACHTDVPFVKNTSSGTQFRFHYEHFSQITGTGTTSGIIDQAGAGNGHALCSECHFRLHSTINKVAGQSVDGSRLVNFAPNVEPVNGVIKWTPRIGSVPGSCTLKCHGIVHDGTAY